MMFSTIKIKPFLKETEYHNLLVGFKPFFRTKEDIFSIVLVALFHAVAMNECGGFQKG